MKNPATHLSLLALIILLCAGCGEISRSEYESARTYDEFITEYQLPNGDTRVVWHGTNPVLDFSGNYTCRAGIRVADFRDGVLVGRFWQNDQAMPK